MRPRLAINRTVAPGLPLPEFLALASGAGVEGVEIRDDVPGCELADGTPVAEIRARIEDAGLAVASINALQRFNDWTGEREDEAAALAARVCSRRVGVGADGLLALDDGTDGADFRMRYRNADGSRATMCGNGRFFG